MAVKIPPLLSKMSKSAQKAWYKKNNMEMPNEPVERSAAAAKRVKVAPRKASDVKPDSVRAINTARMAAYMAKGGRAPIGAAGSGGNSVMAGSNMSTVRGMITGIKAGFNPKVSLDPYESERAKKTGPRSLKLKKEEAEHVEEGNLANKAKKKEAIRQLGLKAMKAGKVDPARGYIPQRAGREQLKKEETKMNEVTKKEAEETLGGPVKTKPKMPPGKQPEGYRYVRALARRAMKAGLKKEEVEQVGEARRMSAAEKLGRAFDQEQQRSAMSRQRGLDLLKQKDTEKMQNKLASGDMTKMKKEEVEAKYIEEKLTAADPASKYVKDFVASENPKFAGKSKKERISMALGAYYAKKRGTNEEVETVDEGRLRRSMRGYAVLGGYGKTDKVRYQSAGERSREINVGLDDKQEKENARRAAEADKTKMKKEEVEQTDEAVRGYIKIEPGKEVTGTAIRRPADQAERDQLARNLIANRKYNVGKNIGKKSGSVRSNAAGMTPSQKISTALRSSDTPKELGPKTFPYTPKKQKITPFLSKEAAEGKVAVTPKEKSLAAHHGDKTKITFGDVLKARLKSAAAKKMGK